MVRVVTVALGVATLALTALAAPTEDEVASLPGQPGPLPSKHYSGYVDGNDGAEFHYYWASAVDVDPATAPVVIWAGGGPGCSAMEAWGTGVGPFSFGSSVEPGNSFAFNDQSLTRLAHVLFLESPSGVGFSYRAGGTVVTDDFVNAEDNYDALRRLLTEKFPEYIQNPLYLVGENHGALVTGMLSDQIMRDPDMTNFRGMIIGGGVASYVYDFNFFHAEASFAFEHGLMSNETFFDVKAACKVPYGDPFGPYCQKVIDDFYTNTVPDVNMNDYSQNCVITPKVQDLNLPATMRRIKAHARALEMKPEDYIALAADGSTFSQLKARRTGGGGGADGDSTDTQEDRPLCADPTKEMAQFLNREDVKTALHVKASIDWSRCNAIPYNLNILDVLRFYRKVVDAKKRVVIFQGNLTMSVPYTSTQRWISAHMKWPVSTAQKPWTVGENSVGTVTGYKANLVWALRLEGAGNTVEQLPTAAAFDMFTRFLNLEGGGWAE